MEAVREEVLEACKVGRKAELKDGAGEKGLLFATDLCV
jgi:hypothetical protein